MPRQLPPLNALRAFEAAGRHQSFSRAAEELGVSHSAISRHVRGLEQRLQAQLFRDDARGVALTDAGRRYLVQVTPAFDAIADASEVFAPQSDDIVNLSCETLFAHKWLLPRLPKFGAANPGIEVRLNATENLADIERFEADMAIRFITTSTTNVPTHMLSNAPAMPYAAPGYAVLPDAEAFLNVHRLRDRNGDPWRQWFSLAGIDLAKVPPPEWRMRAFMAMEAAVLGQGVILSSAENADHEVAQGRLVQMSDIGLRDGAYHVLIGETSGRRRAVRRLRDWLLDSCAPFRT